MQRHTFQNLKLFSVNVKMFVKFGIIGSSNNLGKFLVAFVPFVTNIGQLINLYMTWGDDIEISEMGMNYFMWCVTANGLLRHLTMTRKDKKILKFLKCIENWHKDIERYDDPYILQQLQNITNDVSKFTLFGFIAGSLCALFADLYPLVYDHRKLPMDVHYPFAKIKEMPLYGISYFIQVIILTPLAIANYLPFTNLLITFFMFGRVVLLDLQYKLSHINAQNETKMLRDFKECMAYHNKIIDFRNDLEELVSINGLFDVALFGAMLCMTLFFISIEQDFKLILVAMTFMFIPFYLFCITYYYSNKFTVESLEVANAAYNTPWYEGNLEMRKCVMVMIAKSQRPLEITAGGLYPMTLANFQSLLKVSYSYFTLLQRFNQK
ncbi:odorant receptor Or2-like [Eurosta solidaginis]|uniref:odorant receptor Or2-like n=1 Tax=Eurosta solidaginis TaxID=178769 RepID=UPI003530B431